MQARQFKSTSPKTIYLFVRPFRLFRKKAGRDTYLKIDVPPQTEYE